MLVLVTGANGQLAKEIEHIIKLGKADIGIIPPNVRNAKFIFLSKEDLDISILTQVKDVLYQIKPDVVINCAAYTKVDLCEVNREDAYKINSIGARNIAMISEELGAKIVQISTDYVFGKLGETCKNPIAEYDRPNPVNVYGKTKLFGEEFVKDLSTKYFIVRTSWLYGKNGENFVYKMMKLFTERDAISVVNDEIGNPTNANDLAYHILKIIDTEEYGTYHCTGIGECSWYDFACEILKLTYGECKIKPCKASEYNAAAVRPKYSALENIMLKCTVGNEMREWKDALRGFIKQNI